MSYSSTGAAETVAADDLLARERFWPYQVALVEPLRPVGGSKEIPANRLGVLIRVVDVSTARVDFGRYGAHEVPIEATDLVARVGRVQRGEISKLTPNFVLSVQTRLVDSSGTALRALRPGAAGESRAFRCVFADPLAEDFPELLATLATAEPGPGTLTILVPQGDHGDAVVRDRLLQLDWVVPFVGKRFAAAETRAQLGAGAALPKILELSPEGRLLAR